MHPRRALLSLVTILMAVAVPICAVWAGPGDYVDPSTVKPSVDLYLSPRTNGALPSGDINVTPNIPPNGNGAGNNADGNSNIIPNSFNAKAVPVNAADVTNLQGCGGVGQGEFTSGLFNMPESFTKFQKDVDSLLSKQILTMNYIMPQTAALFDQLNTYGNQRYESFQKGCSLDALKQDARKQYLNTCVAKQLPLRVTALTTALASADPKPTEDDINAQSYAQAWEICSNLYISDTTIVQMRKDSNKAFAEATRAAEDVNDTIKPWLCNISGTTAGQGCFASFLIPQVRLCYDNTLTGACTDSAGYGMKEPIVSMPHLFDIYRFILNDEVVSKRLVPLQQKIKGIGASEDMQSGAATDAALTMSTATVTRLSSTSTVSRVNAPKTPVLDFQLNYLSCKNSSVMLPLEKYMSKLQARLTAAQAKGPDGADATLAMTALDSAVYDKIVLDRVQLMKLTPAPKQDDVDAFSEMLEVSLGCATNQTVPLLDPNLTVAFNTNKCAPEDKDAFYTMASYDAALAATRDDYRYVNLRLKQVYTRLMTERGMPISPTAPTTVSPTVSPELNARLATAVKESMIPYIDSQIDRLDELSRTRGQFAQRVQQIYTSRSGCVTGSSPELSPARPRNGRNNGNG